LESSLFLWEEWFDMVIENELKNEEYIDEFILSPEELKEFDMEETFNNVLEKIRKLKKARNIFINGYHLRLTPDYQPRLEAFTNSVTDKVGNAVEYKLDSEQEYNEFNYHLSKLYETMSKIEIAYINDCLLCNRSENSVKEKFNATRKTFEDAKNSSIARFALAFIIIEYQ
jgi:hypothetical protein